MNNKPFSMIGEVVSVAEHSTYLELVSRVCYYDEPNLNNDMLPYDETTLEKATTLVNMPVQGKYKVNNNGEPTFGSHQMVQKKDGSVEFGTSSIGTHTEVYIENDNVDVNGTIKNLPCLFAKYRIWKRYKNVVAAVQRLFSLGKLYSSWEINTYQYIYDRGIRKVTDYEFLSNCLLGYEFAYPSYGTSANAISLAQLEGNQLMIAEALSQDLLDENINNDDKEENLLSSINVASAEEKVVSPVEEIIAENPVEEIKEEASTESASLNEEKKDTHEVQSAQLTVWDLKDRIREACRTKLGKWCWVSYMFPTEKEVWCEYDGAETELDYVKFTYEVDENDVVTVSEPEYVKLTVSIAEINNAIAELNKEIETTKAELNIKNDAITKASETIQELKTQIAELTPYKEKVDAAEKAEIEKQILAEKDALKAKMLKGGLFTEDEIAEQNIAELIEARDTSAINNLIADRFVASFDSKEVSEKEEVISTDEIASASANLEVEEQETDIRSFMSKVLFN